MSDTSSEYTIDKAGNRVKKAFDNEEERRQARQRKVIYKMKTNIGQFFKENTIGDLLPNNQKLVVLDHELTIAQAIDAIVRQQNINTAVIWNK